VSGSLANAAEETLAWAAERFAPRISLATGFGAEGCVLVEMIGRRRLPIDVFTLDTGLLFPETYLLWRELESRYGVSIRAVRPAETVFEQESSQGPRLWERNPDLCCERRKLAPLRGELAKLDAWVTGIRRDQTADRATAAAVELDARFGLTKVNPLVEWSKDDVFRYARERGVPTSPLYEQGFASIGCVPCTSRVAADESERAGRWRGFTKTECGLHSRRPETNRKEPERVATR